MEYTGAPPAPTGGAAPPAPGSGPIGGVQGSQQPGQQMQQPGQQVTPEMEREDWYKAINGSNMSPQQKQQQIQAMIHFNQTQQRQNPIKAFGKQVLNKSMGHSVNPLGVV